MSELGIGLFVRFAGPLAKRHERIVCLAGRSLIDQNAICCETISQGVTGPQAELFAYLAGNHGLALDRDFGKNGGLFGRTVHRRKISYRSYDAQRRFLLRDDLHLLARVQRIALGKPVEDQEADASWVICRHVESQ